jgi:hypothetical protein
MRFSSEEEWDQAGYALQVALQSLMSMDPRGREDQMEDAIAVLERSIVALKNLGVFSKDFDPSLASY